MVRIILHGCNGKMGQVISQMTEADAQIEIVAGVDISAKQKDNKYPVYEKLCECAKETDVVVDFSNASAVDELLDVCMERQLPLVLCMTGLSEGQSKKIVEAGEKIPILRSSNMSMGIPLLTKLLKEAAKVLVPEGFDVEIIEKHHSQKVDAPSGTARALADAICEEGNMREIKIASVRAGTIVGEHEVLFAGMDEVITLKHTAYSRGVFAKGALEAAKFLKGRMAGLYDMNDVIVWKQNEKTGQGD